MTSSRGATRSTTDFLDGLFGANTDAVLAVDNEAVLDEARSRGIGVLHIDDVRTRRPAAAFVLLTTDEWSHRLAKCAELADTGIVVFKQIVNDGPIDWAMYALDLALRSDVAACLTEQQRVANELIAHGPELRFTGPGTDIDCRLHDDAKILRIGNREVARGEIRGLSTYFETFVLNTVNAKPTFTLNGVCQAVGILSALNHVDEPDPAHLAVNDLVPAVAAEGAEAAFESGRLVSFVVGGTELIDVVRAACSTEFGLVATEVAVGANTSLRLHVDWSINCIMNEGAAGAHFSVGNALDSVHMDIIADAGLETTRR